MRTLRFAHAGVLLLSIAAGAQAAADIAGDLAAADRFEGDAARDATRRPALVLEFLGLERGMTAIDVVAAGGWYTEVLAHSVGRSGKVYAQNPAIVLQFRDGANEKAISARLADGRLANVERLDKEITDLELAPASVDFAITALNFHDVYNGAGKDAASQFLLAIYTVLKPGGVLGLIDHHGATGQDNAGLHRMEAAAAKAVIDASPFVLEAESDLLRNPDDDHTKHVFDPSLGRNTDRFVFRLRKPE